MRKVAIVGAGGHAKVLIDVLESTADARIAGLLDIAERVGQSVLGIDIIGTDEDIPTLMASGQVDTLIIGLGDNTARRRLAERIAQIAPEATFDIAVHAQAHIGKAAELGAGTVVMAGAIVNPACRVGRHCILNTNASLDHDSTMGDFSSLAPNSATGGNVRIGKLSTVGIGAAVLQGVTIGDNSTVGAGSVVLSNVPANVTVVGAPAKATGPQ